MSFSSYANSPEFNRMSRNAADSGIKLLFKILGLGIKFTFDFIKQMVSMVLGK